MGRAGRCPPRLSMPRAMRVWVVARFVVCRLPALVRGRSAIAAVAAIELAVLATRVERTSLTLRRDRPPLTPAAPAGALRSCSTCSARHPRPGRVQAWSPHPGSCIALVRSIYARGDFGRLNGQRPRAGVSPAGRHGRGIAHAIALLRSGQWRNDQGKVTSCQGRERLGSSAFSRLVLAVGWKKHVKASQPGWTAIIPS